ncbi:LytR/AlgR family response regulator transcription factor [Polyangium jinanense]|uniref:Response regulator transcription factor n=1 Tax=Polyangium jinanense TaxID=2829994 RepID=A0A9X3X8X1_9BACT|nr:LytTR family DNA-binding domain-containing protein [Polyangium jinanense]MDC3959540.1 response regulator transcription factor [Polyangium jinanense]MDC3986139.1 response regulator transcription factor [Polyangium jinanense]
MSALRVLVVDDEKLARARLFRLLGAIEDVVIVGECDRGDAVRAALGQGSIDVILLDIEMPGLTGLEAIRLLPEPRPYVIFCTAHAEYAVSAFEVAAVDYLLKPVEAGRLQIAIERARRVISAAPPNPPHAAARRLAIETREGVLLLDPAEISFAELDGALVTIVANGRRVITDLSLAALEERLPAGTFVRVHRRALLNLEHVSLLEPTPSGGYLARTKNGHTVEVSRQAARELRRALGIARGAGGDEA